MSARLLSWREADESEHDGRGEDEKDRIDRPPVWIRPLLSFLWCFKAAVHAVVENSWVKLIYVVVDSVIYSFIMIPFAVRSFLKRQYGARVWTNVRYGPRERNRLDVYFPDPELGVGQYGKSVILFVHGGAWYWGSKTYHSLMQSVSFPESTVVCINYSLHPHAQVQEMCHDISLAIKWTVQNICKKDCRHWLGESGGGAPLVLVAHSAGAHLVALTLSMRCGLAPASKVPNTHPMACFVADRKYGCAPSCPDAHGKHPEVSDAGPWGWSAVDVLAFIGVSGVYKVSDHYLHEAKRGLSEISPMCGSRRTLLTPAGKGPPVMGKKRDEWDCHSPTVLVQKTRSNSQDAAVSGGGVSALPTTFLLHGTDDGVVPFSSSARLYEAMVGAGHPRVHLRGVAGGGHGDVCMDLCFKGGRLQGLIAAEIDACVRQAQAKAGRTAGGRLASDDQEMRKKSNASHASSAWRALELTIAAFVCLWITATALGIDGAHAEVYGMAFSACSLSVCVYCLRCEQELRIWARQLEHGGMVTCGSGQE